MRLQISKEKKGVNEWQKSSLGEMRGADGSVGDCELFVSSILQDENLSRHAQETRGILLNNFRVVHNRNPQEFPYRSDVEHEDSSDDKHSSLGRSCPSDDVSVASDCQEDTAPEYFGDIPTVAAQDLNNILKQGYLEKKRRDKQQKGSFYINGYSAELVSNVRKDSKKNCCFEMNAPGRRSFQFTASSPREAREWVDQINFVLKDLSSSFIPFDDDEEEEEEDEEETYDDIEKAATPPPHPGQVSTAAPAPPGGQDVRKAIGKEEEEEEEDIYEVLPEDELSDHSEESIKRGQRADPSSDYANYYQGLWDCEADRPDELSFHRGDLIYILSKLEMLSSLGACTADTLQCMTAREKGKGGAG
ncbi:Src kinase-associated phosphoprotein 1 [Bagarius yarrelli]|uniref:Src kinase-associated phosphoprotein 1 n=1 Tax=Bagarius yarrelli TaxID=175774 RepID=A0A556TIZ5_BAGYA|nr:Src kinase-associated phosphoprotein 1 [Bagarius yarrelli]